MFYRKIVNTLWPKSRRFFERSDAIKAISVLLFTISMRINGKKVGFCATANQIKRLLSNDEKWDLSCDIPSVIKNIIHMEWTNNRESFVYSFYLVFIDEELYVVFLAMGRGRRKKRRNRIIFMMCRITGDM